MIRPQHCIASLLLRFMSYILLMLAQFCAILLFLWTPVSARILVSVLWLDERNKLKLKLPSVTLGGANDWAKT